MLVFGDQGLRTSKFVFELWHHEVCYIIRLNCLVLANYGVAALLSPHFELEELGCGTRCLYAATNFIGFVRLWLLKLS